MVGSEGGSAFKGIAKDPGSPTQPVLSGVYVQILHFTLDSHMSVC